MKTALVLGAGGFIGSHMVKRLRKEGFWVRGVDLKYPEYSATEANEFVKGDLRDINLVKKLLKILIRKVLIRFTNLLQIWVELDLFSLEIMMPILCIIQFL